MKRKMLGLGILAITMSFCHISGMRSAKIKNESKKPWYFQFVNSGGGSPYSVETYFRADSGRLKLKPGEVSALVRITDRDKETKLYITDDDMYMKNWDDMKRGLAYAFTPGKTRVNIIISDNEGLANDIEDLKEALRLYIEVRGIDQAIGLVRGRAFVRELDFDLTTLAGG